MAPAEESYEFDAPRWAELGAEAQTLASPSVKPWFARRAQATSSPHHRNSSSPPCVAPEVNKVPVAAPRAWAETSKGENHPPRATMVSPTKANVPANEPKTPNTRSRAAAEKAAKVAVVEKSLSVEKVNNSQSGTEKLSSNVKSTPIEMERVLTNASVNDSRTLKEKPTEQKTSPTAKHETQKTESKLGVSPFTCTARCAEKPAISPPSSTPRGSDEAVPVAAMTVDSKSTPAEKEQKQATSDKASHPTVVSRSARVLLPVGESHDATSLAQSMTKLTLPEGGRANPGDAKVAMIVAHDKNTSSEPSQPREERPAKTFVPSYKKLTSDKAAAEQKEKISTGLKASAAEHKEKSGPDHKEKRRDAFPEEPKKRMPIAAERPKSSTKLAQGKDATLSSRETNAINESVGHKPSKQPVTPLPTPGAQPFSQLSSRSDASCGLRTSRSEPACHAPAKLSNVSAHRVPSVAGKPTKASQGWSRAGGDAVAPPSEPPEHSRLAPVPAAATKSTVASQGWNHRPAIEEAKTQLPATTTGGSKGVCAAGPPRLMTSARGERAPPTSSEELEVLRAAKEIQEQQKQRSHWRSQLNKVLSDTSAPSRSTAKLTKPVEFHFHESSRSAPSSPRGSESVTISDQIKEFNKTPRRFRSKGVNDPATPLSKATARKITESKSMTFQTDMRASVRPSQAKSSAQLEAESIANFPKFKARPVSRRVLDSVGDLGVPRVQRPPPTEPKEFHLSSNKNSARAPKSEHEEEGGSTCSAPAYSFKARPANKAIFERTIGIAQVTPRKLTRPISPKLSTSNRSAARATAASADESEDFQAFRARGVPAAVYSPKKIAPDARPITSPRPFHLQSEARHVVAKESLARQLQEATERDKREREFKAKPMRVSEAWAPKLDPHKTEAAPFQLNTNLRGEVYSERLASQRAEAEVMARREREFHARPAKVVCASPFVARKSNKPLTEIKSFNINTDVRSEKRKALEEENARRRAEKEQDAAREAVAKQLQDAAALAELRKKMVPKGQGSQECTFPGAEGICTSNKA